VFFFVCVLCIFYVYMGQVPAIKLMMMMMMITVGNALRTPQIYHLSSTPVSSLTPYDVAYRLATIGLHNVTDDK